MNSRLIDREIYLNPKTPIEKKLQIMYKEVEHCFANACRWDREGHKTRYEIANYDYYLDTFLSKIENKDDMYVEYLKIYLDVLSNPFFDELIPPKYEFIEEKLKSVNLLKASKKYKYKVQIKEFEDGFKVVRKRQIDFEKQYEKVHDELFKDDKFILSRDGIVVSDAKIDEIYKDYKNILKWEKEDKEERVQKVKKLLSKSKKEQKDYVANELISIVNAYLYSCIVRESGPLREFPYEKFKKKYKELNKEILEELYIHVLSVFALVQNKNEEYENVNVRNYVKSQALKYDLEDAFNKYFDENISIDENWIGI